MMKKNKKFLWCPFCKQFPDKIREKYIEDLIETRIWDGNDYGLAGSNIADIEFEQICGVCGHKLIEKNE